VFQTATNRAATLQRLGDSLQQVHNNLSDWQGEVRLILKEAMQIEPDWNLLSLNEAGDYVESEMHKRYPELTPKTLEAIGNYYTYLVR
jgi:hypothetical protein